MAKINRSIALKNFVDSLIAMHPGSTSYPRESLVTLGKKNQIGLLEFTSMTTGYGAVTRPGRGQYIVPASWLSGQAPWVGVVESSVSTQTKKTKSENPGLNPTAEPVPAIHRTANPKKALLKHELFERAKDEIAKRKAAAAVS